MIFFTHTVQILVSERNILKMLMEKEALQSLFLHVSKASFSHNHFFVLVIYPLNIILVFEISSYSILTYEILEFILFWFLNFRNINFSP